MFDGVRRIQQQWSILGAWYRLADAICIVLGLLLATRCELSTMGEHYAIVAAVAIIVYGLLAEVGGMYRRWRGVSAGREVVGVAASWACTVFSLLALAFAVKYTDQFSRISTATWFLATPLLIVLARTTTRWLQRLLLRWGYRSKRFAIVGVTELGFQLARNIEDSPQMGLKLVGYFDDRPEPRNPEIPTRLGQQVGTLQDLVDRRIAARSTASTSPSPCGPKSGFAECWNRSAIRRLPFTWCPTSSSSSYCTRVGRISSGCPW